MNDMVKDNEVKREWPDNEGPDETEIRRLIEWYDSLDEYALEDAFLSKGEWS